MADKQITIEVARHELRCAVDRASVALQAFPRGAMGLTPDSVKATPEYRSARQAYEAAFSALRQFNTIYKPARRRA